MITTMTSFDPTTTPSAGATDLASEIRFLKGHGTENDFVVILDESASLRLSEESIRAITNRRSGIGGDGILRVARAGDLYTAGELDAIPEDVEGGDWFMDYRNADGSIAEMCGNGVRVFAHALVATGLADAGEIRVGTRAGLRPASVAYATAESATVSVSMGIPEVLGVSTVAFEGHTFAGLAVDVGNPHVAAIVPRMTSESLATLPIDVPPSFDEEFFPNGVNVEISTPLVDGEVTMRVHERGAGETRSCGTGIVATAIAALADAEKSDGTVLVNVPGGQVQVEIVDGHAQMTGPSRLVALGTLGEHLLKADDVRE